MAKFNVYQINFTPKQVKEINSQTEGRTVENYRLFLNTLIAPTPEAIHRAGSLYRLVAQIEAENLEDVFNVGNIGPEAQIQRFGRPMHSLSVGDVIDVCADKTVWYVDSFGFKQLEDFEQYL